MNDAANDEVLLQNIADTIDAWAKVNGGRAFPAGDLDLALQILWQVPGAPRVAVVCEGESIRGNIEELGRVDRRFSLLISRGKGLRETRGQSLTSGTGGGPGMLKLVRSLRDFVRSFVLPGTAERVFYYKGYDVWGKEYGAPIDCYRLQFECGVQLTYFAPGDPGVPLSQQPPTDADDQ